VTSLSCNFFFLAYFLSIVKPWFFKCFKMRLTQSFALFGRRILKIHGSLWSTFLQLMVRKSGLSRLRYMLSIVGRVPQLTSLPIPFIFYSGSSTRNIDSEMTMYTSIIALLFIFCPCWFFEKNSFSWEHGYIATPESLALLSLDYALPPPVPLLDWFYIQIC
jgi:hypothetical protein